MSTATLPDQLELELPLPATVEPAVEPSETGLPLATHVHRALAALETQALTMTDLDTLRIAYRTLTRHQPTWDYHQGRPNPNCPRCHTPDPCPHVTAIAAALGL